MCGFCLTVHTDAKVREFANTIASALKIEPEIVIRLLLLHITMQLNGVFEHAGRV